MKRIKKAIYSTKGFKSIIHLDGYFIFDNVCAVSDKYITFDKEALKAINKRSKDPKLNLSRNKIGKLVPHIKEIPLSALMYCPLLEFVGWLGVKGPNAIFYNNLEKKNVYFKKKYLFHLLLPNTCNIALRQVDEDMVFLLDLQGTVLAAISPTKPKKQTEED